jgi:outer membrane lipoprotein SlyB
MFKKTFLPVAAVASLALAGCATNNAGEGALAGGVGGAVIGAATGGNVVTGAVVGAAAGALVGSMIKKNGNCYRMTRDGREVQVSCN